MNKEILNQSFWQELYSKALDWAVSELPSIIILIILIFVAFRFWQFLIKRIRHILKKRISKNEEIDPAEAEKRVNTLLGIVKSVGRLVIWAVFVLILLKKIGIDIGPLLAGAGIAGLAIGFGAQELVRDFISGFFILLEDQIRTGDVAIVNGTGGLVEKIELRTISLRDFSGVVHIFQNGKINTMANMTKEWSAMVFDIGVAYKEDPVKVMHVMREVADELQNDPDFSERIIEPMEIFGVDQFGDSAVVIKARLKTKPIQQWNVGREYRKRLKQAFDNNGIEIPFPHRTVYWGEKIESLKVEMENTER